MLLTAALLAGCGSASAPKVLSGDVAEVGNQHVTLAQYNVAIATAEATKKAQKTAVPKAGTSAYATMQTEVMGVLVQYAEFNAELAKLHLTPVTAADVDKEIALIAKQHFGGSQAKYFAAVKAQGFTVQEIRAYIGEELLGLKVYNQVTKSAKATPAQIAAYYDQNITSYEKPATRKVREILAGKNKKALAETIYDELKAGASWTTLAKKYSQDPGSKDKGGLFTATKGEDVPAFDAAVFAASAKTNVLLKPVDTPQYGWFVIEPLAAIVPGSTESEQKAAPSIRSQLDQSQQSSAYYTWLDGIEKSFCSGNQISYEPGYAPSPDPCASITAPNQTTT